MLYRIPDFYGKFHCIADKCTDNCCIGWEIDVDEDTQKKYRAENRPFAMRVRDKIQDGHFVLTEEGRCPFLNAQGLCEVYRNLGESYTGAICREHPRFVEVYGDVMERGLGLCCEEATRLLLETDSPVVHLVNSQIDEPEDEISDVVREARDSIFVERDNLFTILSQETIPLNRRLQMLLDYAESTAGIERDSSENNGAEDVQNFSREEIIQAWIDVLGKGESYGPSWNEAYRQIKEKDLKDILQDETKENQAQGLFFTDREGSQIISYTLFRYYAKTLFDGDSLGKVQFAIFFWLILKAFGQELAGIHPLVKPKIAAIKLLSKQIEYSDEVMEILAEAFVNDDHFSIESFRTMLE